MARICDDAPTGKYMVHAAASPVTAAPLTLACWGRPETATVNQMCIGLADAVTTHRWVLSCSTSQQVVAGAAAGGAEAQAGIGSWSINTWQHFAATFESDTSRYSYLDGVQSTQNTTSVAPIGVNHLNVGSRPDAALPFVGMLAEAAVWNVALTLAEIVSLAKGFAPSLIRPTSLVAYWPLFGNDSPELDRWNGRYDLTLFGPPDKAEHPRIYYPSQVR